MLRMRQRMTYGNVVATLALFIALGGTSYAAVTLPRNSVGSAQLRTGSVASADVRDRSLALRDLSPRAIRTLGRPTGAPTPAANQAPAAPGGVVITVKSATGNVPIAPADESSTAGGTASCDPGQRVTGGGVKVETADEMSVADSYPDAGGTKWSAHVDNGDESAGHSFTVYALCTP
jgi:hypothetical protein